MKKALILLILIIILLSLISCSLETKESKNSEPTATQTEKTYKITVYSCEPKIYVAISELAAKEGNLSAEQVIKMIVEETSRTELASKIYNKLDIDTYYGKEVIDYSDTTVRFIDKSNKEQFISAYYIKVELQ